MRQAPTDRLPQLLEAAVNVGTVPELRATLQRIVEYAAELTDARHAALGVADPDDGTVTDLFTSGPAGPADLTVPIRVYSEVFGSLALAGKRGGGDFTGEDIQLSRVLAVEAGIAIGNARMYEAARQRERWIDGAAAVTAALLTGEAAEDALDVVAEQARKLAEAVAGIVLLPAEEGGMEIVAVSADRPAGLLGTVVEGGSPVLRPLLAGEPVFTDDPATDLLAASPARTRFGPTMVLPLQSGDRVIGALALPRGEGDPPYTAVERLLAAQFASQAALALVLADAQRDRERLAVFEDRDRIARDLHDLVVQRLFATGLMLQGTRRRAQGEGVAELIGTAVDELDATIQEVRTAIFALQQGPAEAVAGVRARVMREAGAAAALLGFAPRVRFTGPVDAVVTERVAKDLVAALREALSNALRHAGASRVEVAVAVEQGEGGRGVRLTVTDDGVGIPAEGRRSGLRNLARRAEALGGSAHHGPGPDGTGTTVHWHVPL